MLDMALGGQDHESWYRGADILAAIRGYGYEEMLRMPVREYQTVLRVAVENQKDVAAAKGRCPLMG